MTRVSTRNLKNQLSSYLHRAEAGERIEVLRGGKPVAVIVPLSALPGDDEVSRLASLAARGIVVLPRRESARIKRSPRVPARTKPAAQMVIEDRR